MGRVYDAKVAPRGTVVLFEGWPLPHCLRAHEGEGWAEVATLGHDDCLRLTPDGTAIQTARYHGRVEIRFPPAADGIPW